MQLSLWYYSDDQGLWRPGFCANARSTVDLKDRVMCILRRTANKTLPAHLAQHEQLLQELAAAEAARPKARGQGVRERHTAEAAGSSGITEAAEASVVAEPAAEALPARGPYPNITGGISGRLSLAAAAAATTSGSVMCGPVSSTTRNTASGAGVSTSAFSVQVRSAAPLALAIAGSSRLSGGLSAAAADAGDDGADGDAVSTGSLPDAASIGALGGAGGNESLWNVWPEPASSTASNTGTRSSASVPLPMQRVAVGSKRARALLLAALPGGGLTGVPPAPWVQHKRRAAAQG